MIKPKHRRELAQNIRAARKAKGLSQELLAEKADLHHNTIGRFERAEMEATVAAVLKIAAALGVTPGELLDDIKPPSGSPTGVR